MTTTAICLIPALPLLGFLINGLWYAGFQATGQQKKAHATIPGILATLAIFSSFVLSVKYFFELSAMPVESRAIEEVLFSWIKVSGFKLDFAFRLDALNSLFTLVITGVGTLIHLYSIGYMSHDESPTKFFSYLNLFCFAMLILVLGASLPVLFFGWEGVGLCSYLLIGYWYQDQEKASAGKKAFIVNRIGDFGFILGMFLLFSVAGTLDFNELRTVFQHGIPDGVTVGTITTICLLLFVGCTGKSAQIPLYVWLPDAMAGPTPVSALIHAATMVTSGIYMMTRLNFVFSLSSTALMVIATVGAATAFFAATIAITQTDIKKVLAYSTVSQLGYMFLGCGVGAFSAGVFHVMTHAFFKALLFLGAGSVIHGMHEEQNILKMGGLRKYMPQTFIVFTIAWLAICGIPPFSGFFSKDEILWMTFSGEHGSKILWFVGALTAGMTAFYMTRLYLLTFFGKERFDHHHVHPHESPLIMILPLAVLALLSAVGGFLGIPHHSFLEHWLEPVLHHAGGAGETLVEASHSLEYVLMVVSVGIGLLGIFAAWKIYGEQKNKADELKNRFIQLHRGSENKWYIDEIYEAIFVKPIHQLSLFLWKFVDVLIIDGAVLGFAKASDFSGKQLRKIQTGSIQNYTGMLVIALAIIAVITLCWVIKAAGVV